MDKNTITGLVLIAILLVGFSFLSRPSEEQIAAQKKYYDSIAVVQKQEEALKAKAAAALANEKGEATGTVDSTSLFFNAMQGKESFTTIQNNLVEIVEIPALKWFVGTQFHPEYSSTVLNPHPLFVSFIKAAISK